MIVTLFEILGSLGVFLFGMKVMSEGIQKVSGDRLRGLMRSMTQNRFAGITTGLLITSLVQSSSATTVMIVSFVNAQLITLTESIGLIMGANLGTTTTFWIVSYLGFKFSLTSIALPIIGVGLPMIFFRKSQVRNTGEVFIGFGLLFLGLLFLKDAVPDIRNNPEVLSFLQHYTGRGIFSVLFFFIIGTVLTVVVQSSSVAGAITLTLAYKGWIDFPSAAAIILGENVGTTITANLAAIGTSLPARQAARAHFLFNIVGVLWMLVLFNPFIHFVDWILPGTASDPTLIPIRMALFHSLFNFCNICLVVGFVPQFAALVQRFVRDRGKPGRPSERAAHLGGFIPETGELNLAESEMEVQKMAALTQTMFQGFVELFENPDKDLGQKFKEMRALEEQSDKMAVELTNDLLHCTTGNIGDRSLAEVSVLLRLVAEFEDICDCCYRLALSARRDYRKRYDLPAEARAEISTMAKAVIQFMEFYRNALKRDITAADMEIAYQLEGMIDQSRKQLRKTSIRRMQEATQVKGEVLYIDVINNMEKIGNHALNILQTLRQRR
ncbi:MAG: Na/Pi cotransporter family protein [Opitutaceae bacterium]